MREKTSLGSKWAKGCRERREQQRKEVMGVNHSEGNLGEIPGEMLWGGGRHRAALRVSGFWGQVSPEGCSGASLAEAPQSSDTRSCGARPAGPQLPGRGSGNTPKAPSCWDVPPGPAGASAAITVTVGCETEHLSSPACILYYIYYIILYLLDYIILYYIIRAVRPSTSRLEPSAPQLLG